MNTFNLRLLATDKVFYEGECLSLVVPTNEGYYGFQAHHQPMIAAIIPGTIKMTMPDGTVSYAAVSNGIVKTEDNDVLILVETAERPEEIDENRAKAAAEAAKEAILQKRSIQDYYAAQARMARAISRLKTKQYDTRR